MGANGRVFGPVWGFGVLFLSCVCVSVSGVLFSVGVCVCDLLIFLHEIAGLVEPLVPGTSGVGPLKELVEPPGQHYCPRMAAMNYPGDTLALAVESTEGFQRFGFENHFRAGGFSGLG